ncbi:MAG: hypothetical protein L6R39_000998 [Caloplaca ligustica]|nr:MAG: hypothetical protein L6R39_000998 [Caloplaca ligustica]
MRSHSRVLCPTPIRSLKRTLTDLEVDYEPVSKRTRFSPGLFPTPPYSTQDEHLKESSPRCEISDWRDRLKSSLLRPLDVQDPSTTKQLAANPQLTAWLDAIPCPRTYSCPASPRTFSPPGRPHFPDHPELKRPRSCQAYFDLLWPKQPATGSFAFDSAAPKGKRARLTLASLQTMSQAQSQCAESTVPRFNPSSKGPCTSDAAYVDTLYSHGINMDLSGRKLPRELAPLKERILQTRSSP